jgi:uncharacterized membrane protein
MSASPAHMDSRRYRRLTLSAAGCFLAAFLLVLAGASQPMLGMAFLALSCAGFALFAAGMWAAVKTRDERIRRAAALSKARPR